MARALPAEYDRDGSCLEDSGGDGICNARCTDLRRNTACNYDPTASDDDGSCDFCSCFQTTSDTEAFQVELGWWPRTASPGTTSRLYATTRLRTTS